MTTPQAPPAERKSECTACPSWVLACAHLGDRRVWLRSGELTLVAGHGRFGSFTAAGPGRFEECSSHPEAQCGYILSGLGTDFPDLPSAQAEFDRRAEELRAQ